MTGPKRNRVTPTGEIVAVPRRGAWTGNRGNLHRGTEIVRYHRGSLWITCALRFKDWRLPQWAPGRFTLLFFHDEAVALAAGHRPCALCRRADYTAYRDAWAAAVGGPPLRAAELDRQLHSERIVRGTHRRRWHPMPWSALPDGTFVLLDGGAAPTDAARAAYSVPASGAERPALVVGDALVPWTTAGYTTPVPRPRSGQVRVITPPSSVAALRAGYRPQLDPAAQASIAGVGRLS